MAHRGPDDRGLEDLDGMVLGHARLSIVDLDGGHQPMRNEAGDLWLVANGEIYNHLELRQRLGRHRFRTRSDSEVALHLYEEMGSNFVRHLRGMYALAIYGRGRLLLARDPLGIKPLYYGYDAEGNLRFASEIAPLAPFVRRVHEFPAGHVYLSGRGLSRFWDLPERPAENAWIDDPDEAVALLDQRLRRAVLRRLMADVPLGVFLSGGLDSSLIAAITRQLVQGELHSFAVGLEGSTDLSAARRVAEHLGTTHHERVLTPGDIVAAVPEVVARLESYDPPLVRSAIPTAYVSRLAREHVTVVLSGEGADELFAGYHYLAGLEGRALDEEQRQITRALHNTNLQRVDRLTMAVGLEGRVPFLDIDLVELAFRIHPRLRRREDVPEGEMPEKWVLRRLAERYLPPDVVWRKKEKFAVGSGVAEILERYAERAVDDLDLARARHDGLGLRPLRNKEELLYFRAFQSHFGEHVALVEPTLGWSRSLNPGQIFS